MEGSETIEEVFAERLQGAFQNIGSRLIGVIPLQPKKMEVTLARGEKPSYSRIVPDAVGYGQSCAMDGRHGLVVEDRVRRQRHDDRYETARTGSVDRSTDQSRIRASHPGSARAHETAPTETMLEKQMERSKQLNRCCGCSIEPAIGLSGAISDLEEITKLNRLYRCGVGPAIAPNGAISDLKHLLTEPEEDIVEYDDILWETCSNLREEEKFKRFLNTSDLISPHTSSESVYEILVHSGNVEIKIQKELAQKFIEEAIFKLRILEQYSKCASFIQELVDYQPYIKHQERETDIYDRLDKDMKLPPFTSYVTSWAIGVFCSVLGCMEGDFHQDLRKEYRDDLFWVIDMRCRREYQKQKKLCWPFWDDLDVEEPRSDLDSQHTFSMDDVSSKVKSYFRSKEYTSAKRVLDFHRKFDRYLTKIKTDSVLEELAKKKRPVPSKFKDLPDDLICQSIEVRRRNIKRRLKASRILKLAIYLVELYCSEKLEFIPRDSVENLADPEYANLSSDIRRLGHAWANKIIHSMKNRTVEHKSIVNAFRRIICWKMESYLMWIENQLWYDGDAYLFLA